MKNLIYYKNDKCDIYFKTFLNKYEKANDGEVCKENMNKFNLKKSIVTFEVQDFLIKAVCMPLDNYIDERILNSLKFYFNSYDEDILYDYFLLDSDLKTGQVKLLLYAIKIKENLENILKYIDKSYLVVKPVQFILTEYICYRFSLKSGVLVEELEKKEKYNIIIFKNGLIFSNEYINKEQFENLDQYLNERLSYVRKEFDVIAEKHVYFLNFNTDKEYNFKVDLLEYTLEEILTNYDYIRSKFSKLWKKKENYKKNA